MPGHTTLLEEMMGRAGLSESDRCAVRTSVIAPKWNRKLREKAMFSGQAADEGPSTHALAEAEPDLVELGVDEEYASALIEGCRRHSKREYDPDEVGVAQLRELVSMAEEYVGGMRNRLAGCQDRTRTTLHDISARLDSLEQLVHTSLAEIVAMAGAAGISSGPAARGALVPVHPSTAKM